MTGVSDDEIMSAIQGPGGGGAAPGGVSDADISGAVTGGPAPGAQPQPAAAGKWMPHGKDLMSKVFHYEGEGKTDPNSGAVDGFLPSTWADLSKKYAPQLAGKIQDPAAREQLFNAYMGDAKQQLQRNGVPVSDASLYGSWWLGPSGYLKAFNADPSMPMDQLVGQQTARNNGWLKTDPKTGAVIRRATVGDFHNELAQRMGTDPVTKLDPVKTAQLAAQNFVPDLERNVGGVYHAVTHPGETLRGLGRVGSAIGTTLEGWSGNPVDPQAKADADQLWGQAGDYARSFTSPQGIAHNLAYEPVTTGMVAATPLDLGAGAARGVAGLAARGAEMAGGASALGRGLDVASNVARGVGDAAGVAARVADPIGTTLGAAASGLAPRVTRLDGSLTPAAERAISEGTQGALSGADVAAMPAAQRNTFLSTLRTKGLSPEAVNEAVLRSQKLEAPMSVASGIAAPEVAREEVESIRRGNATGLGQTAREIAGAETPSSTDLAAKFAEAQANSLNGLRDRYDAIAQMPGTFGHAVDGVDLNNALAKQFATNPQLPLRSGADLSAYLSKGVTPEAQKAWQGINDVMVNGSHAMSQGLTAPELMQLRRNLTDALYRAKGEDAAAMRHLIDGWQAHVQDLADQGKFVDASGQPVSGFMEHFRQANGDYAKHMATYHDGAFGKAANVLGNTTDASGRMVPTTDAAAQMDAQATLAKNLFHPTSGANHYNQLSDALAAAPGGQEALDDFLRQSVFQTHGGQLAPDRGVVQALRSDQSAVAKAFAKNPGQLAQARAMHYAHEINAAPFKRGARRHGVGRSILGGMGKMGARAAAGYVGDKIGGLPGFFIAQGLEHGGEKVMDAVRRGRELRGVPKHHGHHLRLLHAPLDLTRAALEPGRVVAAHALTAAAARPGHAKGGKVESDGDRVERLVGRLMSMAKHAKKAANASTEPLLQAPDEAIVKALAVAQKAI